MLQIELWLREFECVPAELDYKDARSCAAIGTESGMSLKIQYGLTIHPILDFFAMMLVPEPANFLRFLLENRSID